MDSWIDAFAGSSFVISAQVELKPNDSQELQQNTVQHVRLKVSSMAPPVISPKATSEVSLTSQGFTSLFSTDREPHLKYCPCDIQNKCTKSPVVTLSHSNRHIKICIRGPINFQISQSSLSMLGKHLLVSQPSFIIENDEENVAFISGQLSDKFFEIVHHGVSIIGTASIVEEATTTKAGFFVHYVIDNSLQPIISSSVIYDHGQSEKKDIPFRVNDPSLSTKFMFEIEVVDDGSVMETLEESFRKKLTSSSPSVTITTLNTEPSSATPTTSKPLTFTAIPTVLLPLGAKICQCDQESNVCLADDLQISYSSKDDIHICIM